MSQHRVLPDLEGACAEGGSVMNARAATVNLGRSAGTINLLGSSSWANGEAFTSKMFGGGSAASPLTSATPDLKFLELRCETTAPSGDNRLAYLRYALEGGGGGECLRASTVVNSNVATAHGAHFGIEFEALAGGSECSGLGVGLRGTLMIPNVTSWAPSGTYAAGMLEIYSEGSDSDPAGMTELSLLRLVNAGDSSGRADVDTDAYLFSIQGFTSAADTTKLVSTVSLDELSANSIALRIKVGASDYWLLAVPTSELN